MNAATVQLPDRLAERLAEAAAQRGLSVAEVAVEAIDAYLSSLRPRRIGFAGIVETRPGLEARHTDEVLAREGFGRSSS